MTRIGPKYSLAGMHGGSMAPPPAGNAGDGESRFLSWENDLLDMLRQRVGRTMYHTYDIALTSLVRAADAIETRASPEMNIYAATTSLKLAIDESMRIIDPIEWPNIASALLLIYRMSLKQTHQIPQQSTLILKACANFFMHADRRFADQDGNDRASQDFVLATTTMSLLEGADLAELRPQQKTRLAAVVHRMAIVSASLYWPTLGLNLSGASSEVTRMYNEEGYATLSGGEFLHPTSYLKATWPWRSERLGAMEYLVATYVENGVDNALRLCEQLESKGVQYLDTTKAWLNYAGRPGIDITTAVRELLRLEAAPEPTSPAFFSTLYFLQNALA